MSRTIIAMTEAPGRINWILGLIVAFLAATAAATSYLNWDRPAVPEGVAPNPAQMDLPENHPPVDALNRITSLSQASQNDPKNADLKVQLGNAYYDAGLYNDAIQAYEASVVLQAPGPHVQTDLATCYHYIGQHDKALAMLNTVLGQNPDFHAALYNKGIILQFGKGDAAGAIAAWEELLRVNPNHPQRAGLEQKIRELRAAAR